MWCLCFWLQGLLFLLTPRTLLGAQASRAWASEALLPPDSASASAWSPSRFLQFLSATSRRTFTFSAWSLLGS